MASKATDVVDKEVLSFTTSITDTFVTLQAADVARVVHKDLLCQKSKFFVIAFDGSFKEAAEQKVTLDTTDTTLNDFLDWLYFGRLFEGRDLELQTRRVDLYRMADMYDVPLLKNHIFRSLHEYLNTDKPRLFFPKIAHRIYTSLPSSDPLCRMLVQIYIRRFGAGCPIRDDNDVENSLLEMPVAFWITVAHGMSSFLRVTRGLPTVAEFLDQPLLGATLE